MSRHYIRVRTGGSIQDEQDVIEQRATFSRLVSVIQDEIDDVTDEYAHQIQESALAAIRFCERERFYFNESMDVVFNTGKGKSIYGAPEAPHIETSAKIKGGFLHKDRQAKVALEHRDALSLGPLIASGQTGSPVCYSYFDRKLYLYPIPDSVYQIQLILSPIRFEYPANDILFTAPFF
ncbi:hypothetical protein [Bartonella rattaustraliani]|uniref:hypothetical protein n=1 Tax=Bartonella rattaustraliani TaxID=481139 RepID=UPI0002F28FB5